MVPLGILILSAVGIGGAAAAFARRQPTIDPASPRATRLVARGIEHELRAHGRLDAFVRNRLNPQAATGLLLTAVGGIVVVLGVLAFLVRSDSGVLTFDRQVERWANDHLTGTARDVVSFITELGGTWAIAGVALAVALFEMRRPSRRWVVPFLVVAIVGETILVTLIKLGVDRVRPELGQGLDGSFPSGHSANAAVTYAAAALLLSRARPRALQAALIGVAVALAVATATSRVLLGVHFVTDTVAGLVFGWAWFALVAMAFGGRLLRFGAPVEAAERHQDLVEQSTTADPPAEPARLKP